DATEHSVEDFNDLGVVVWVQKADNEVLNATNAIATPLSVANTTKELNIVSVFPNPAGERTVISIETEGSNSAAVKVIDMVGKTVINLNSVNLVSGKNNLNLNTSKLNGGVYFVQVMIDGEVSTTQLVIQK
ncbi:MAG: T9SS type A sorting domain-containing protein, partial [Salibacteraceae bacterium]